ncbi:MAG: carboxypeptidase regulatory-like domain-containing protein [Acidobacteria bacterium]|nr:carboxypeptidase regulatory-like domain-containing protein [Acidobacteriota bacterium]
MLAAAASVYAQGTNSRITGVVTDSSGAAVSGANVTLTNEGTNATLTTQTSDSGAYTFDLIQPGKYQVAVEKVGFKKFVSKGNAALINQPTTVNVALEVGDVSATITVESSAEQVQTSTSGNLGSTIEQRTLESLPIVGTRGRNPLDLLNFQPGVVFGGNTGGAVNVNGSRDRSFNFTLDGIDINESTAGGSNFTPLRPNPDSVQEFQIVTSNFTAELGRSSGAQVTLVTRSGTNNFHGSLFDYYQTPRFNAKSYPTTIQPIAPKEQFVQHIFGGSLGGPLFNPGFGEGTRFKFLRDKAFFFVNLQFLRAYDTALVTRTVYTPSARAGLFRYVTGRATTPAGTTGAAVDAAGNQIIANCPTNPPTTAGCVSSYNVATTAPVTIDPTLQALINAMPLPNNFTVGDGLNTAGFNFASPQHEKQYDFVSKFDFKLRENNLFYIRYAQGSQSSFGDSGNGGRPIFPGFPNFVDTSRTPKNLAFNWRWSPTAKIGNEFIFGISDYFFKFATPQPDANLPFAFINPATPNTNFSYNARGVKTYQFIDNVTFMTGNHTIKGGLNFRFNRHKDDRSSVAGSAIEPIVGFGSNLGFTGYNLPTAFNATTNPNGIVSADLTRLQNTINDLLGRINSVSQAFVSNPDNPDVFAPANTRWINKALYTELDFYVQDNWRFRPNLVFDIGVRWEPKLKPSIADRQILVPNQPVKLGALPTNTLKWVEGDLFKSDFSKILPSVGFAWDPFKNGKTSIRANYRLASDRFATFLFGSSIFQGMPGNNTARTITNSDFPGGAAYYRNLGSVLPLAPTTTPVNLRQPPAFSVNSINVIDPDLQYPQIHEWSFSVQREVMKGNVVEVNYIGKHALHLLGGYNVNQVNVNASDPRCPGETFLSAFVAAQANVNSCLVPLLVSTNGAGGSLASFRTTFSSQLANNSVASVAQTLAQRSGTTSLTANGFSPFFFQNYPQFAGGLNVFDTNDYSNYHGLQLIFKRRISNGLGFQVGYTFSKSLDNRSWDPSLSTISTGSAQSAGSTPFDNRNRRINYTYSDFDRRHVFQGTYVYELPFGQGKWLAANNKVVDYIVGGWQLSGSVVWMTGRPFTVYSGSNTISNIVQATADCSGCPRALGQLVLESGRNFWFDTAARGRFSVPAAGALGNTGRNYFITPIYFQTDASLLKKFKITERINVDFRVDARNLTNNPSFDLPTALITSSIFGRINDSVTNTARRIQFSAKVNF